MGRSRSPRRRSPERQRWRADVGRRSRSRRRSPPRRGASPRRQARDEQPRSDRGGQRKTGGNAPVEESGGLMDEAAVMRMMKKQREQDEATGKRIDPSIQLATNLREVQDSKRGARMQPMELGESVIFSPSVGAPDGAIIFLHGLGERAPSWANTFKNMRSRCPDRWKWVFLRAGKIAQPSRAQSKEPSWGKVYSTDCMHVGSADHEHLDREGFYLSSSDAIRRAVEDIKRKDALPSSRVLLVGFSQGAAVGLLCALANPSLFGGVISCSGWLLPHVRGLIASGKIAGAPPVLLAHGTNDAMVGYDCAEFAAATLRGANVGVNLEPVEGGGHSMNGRMMKLVGNFVSMGFNGKPLYEWYEEIPDGLEKLD